MRALSVKLSSARSAKTVAYSVTSMIDNMVDVASRMAKVNVSDDPVIAERIKDLQSLVGTYANNKDMLRNEPVGPRESRHPRSTHLMRSRWRGLV